MKPQMRCSSHLHPGCLPGSARRPAGDGSIPSKHISHWHDMEGGTRNGHNRVSRARQPRAWRKPRTEVSMAAGRCRMQMHLPAFFTFGVPVPRHSAPFVPREIKTVSLHVSPYPGRPLFTRMIGSPPKRAATLRSAPQGQPAACPMLHEAGFCEGRFRPSHTVQGRLLRCMNRAQGART